MAMSLRPHFILIQVGIEVRTWLICGTSDRGKATLIFGSLESAQRFVDGKGLAADWKPAELPSTEFESWIAECGRQGVAHVIVDPDPATEDHRVIPLVALLVETEFRKGD